VGDPPFVFKLVLQIEYFDFYLSKAVMIEDIFVRFPLPVFQEVIVFRVWGEVITRLQV